MSQSVHEHHHVVVLLSLCSKLIFQMLLSRSTFGDIVEAIDLPLFAASTPWAFSVALVVVKLSNGEATGKGAPYFCLPLTTICASVLGWADQ